MNVTTYSLRSLQPPPSFTDTARDMIRDIRTMSTQTKARLELTALLLGLFLTIASAVKVFVFLPPRVDAVEKGQAELVADLKAVQAKAAATDVAIAGIAPQLAAMNQGILRIESDVREIRRAKSGP
jgi:hypothetical protein